MLPRSIVTLFCLVLSLTSLGQTPFKPSPTELKNSYIRANEFQKRAEGAALNLNLKANWFDDGRRLWYRRELPDRSFDFLQVQAQTGKSSPAFDHARLAEALSKHLGRDVKADRLPFAEFSFAADSKSISLKVDGKTLRVSLVDYRIENTVVDMQTGRLWPEVVSAMLGRWPLAPNPGTPVELTTPLLYEDQGQGSPQRPFEVRIQDGQIEIRKSGTVDWKRISKAGSYGRFEWSPDGAKILAFRLLPGDHKPVFLLKSSVPGTTRAVLEQRLYDQPGDKMDMYETFILDPVQESEDKVALDPIMGGGQPWAAPPEARWWQGKAILDFPVRGYQEVKVVEIDVAKGTATSLIDERSPTFLDTTKTMLRLLDNGREMIWRSERSGWSHLYLVNRSTGESKPITSGNWVVRSIEFVDESKRQVWFTANGVDSKQDPYHIHFCRTNLDGSGFVDLTVGDGNHSVQFSPDRAYYVDTYSRVDSAPVHELRRSTDGSLIRVLERANIDLLLKNGVRLPERFVAKGRDGKTDIWGIVVKPSNFDPKRKYPVIENIYAGPHDSFVPKSFRPFLNMNRLAELGFIVVQIDGMGTSNRGKAFHDVCWKNVADAGFPDRILWLQALAKKMPQADIERVGLYGTSAGGQSSTGGVLFHPEFYKVAVSSCGCHDNRIDKQWWNEQWMGYPVGPHYAANSNIDNAARLKGKLMLIVGENDRNVPPETTFRLADALIKAQKEFELVVIPGADHTDGGPYGERKRRDFFVRHLLAVDPPSWND